jgi:hypothetical protein
MKIASLSICLAAIALSMSSAVAAPKQQQPKRTYDYCRDLALQRGFLTPGKGVQMRGFVGQCMHCKVG